MESKKQKTEHKQIKLSEITEPACTLYLNEADKFVLVSGSASNTKLPKDAKLVMYDKNSTLTPKLETGYVYDVGCQTNVHVRSIGKIMTLAKAIQLHFPKCTNVFGYNSFPAGAVPKVFVESAAEKAFRFTLKEGDAQLANKVIDCARGANGLQVLWFMGYEEAKCMLMPKGICIFSKCSLCCPGLGLSVSFL